MKESHNISSYYAPKRLLGIIEFNGRVRSKRREKFALSLDYALRRNDFQKVNSSALKGAFAA